MRVRSISKKNKGYMKTHRKNNTGSKPVIETTSTRSTCISYFTSVHRQL